MALQRAQSTQLEDGPSVRVSAVEDVLNSLRSTNRPVQWTHNWLRAGLLEAKSRGLGCAS